MEKIRTKEGWHKVVTPFRDGVYHLTDAKSECLDGFIDAKGSSLTSSDLQELKKESGVVIKVYRHKTKQFVYVGNTLKSRILSPADPTWGLVAVE